MECLLPSLWLMILFVLERPSLYGAAFALGSFHFCLTRHVHTYVLNNGDYQLLLWNMIVHRVCKQYLDFSCFFKVSFSLLKILIL